MNHCRPGAPHIIPRLLPLWLLACCAPAYAGGDLADLSIDQLLNMEITTASKKEQKLSETSAAVFVLTHDDILRSGATTLPELLLNVPGVEGGMINSHSAAIGIRGLSGQWSNKLVVLIDGRSVYTRTFSGVYWDSYNIPLEDIERIEVIRGANTALWGANAVNGVINIITRNSGATQGTLLRASAGTNESGDLLARQGFKLGERGFGRVYASGEKHGNSAGHPDGEADDDWGGSRVGFRGDWDSTTGTRLMAEGDIYHLRSDNNPLDPATLPPNSFPVGAAAAPSSTVNGHSILLNLTQAYALTSEWSLQFAWSRDDRDEFLPIVENNYDVDFQHHFQPWDGHDLVWGANVRYRTDETQPIPAFGLEPADAEDSNSSLFFQDEIAAADGRVLTTLGARLEYDEHNQWVFQPSLRVLWNISAGQKLWGAVSRAARTPSRVDRDLVTDFPANLWIYHLTARCPPHCRSAATRILRPRKCCPTNSAIDCSRSPTFRSTSPCITTNTTNCASPITTATPSPPKALSCCCPLATLWTANVYGGELVTSWAPTNTLRLQAFWSEIRLDLERPVIRQRLRLFGSGTTTLHRNVSSGCAPTGILPRAGRPDCNSSMLPNWITPTTPSCCKTQKFPAIPMSI